MDWEARHWERAAAGIRGDVELAAAMDATDEAIDRRKELVRETSIETSRRGDGSIMEGEIE